MYAPIILFVYNRPEHTKKTLEALSKNILADQSILYIFSDGSKENDSEENIDKVGLVRHIIASDKWCKTVHIINADRNKGLANSIIDGVTEIINKHGNAIILEDDIVTSTTFLRFMNTNLQYYENETNVFGISGYCYPGKKITETTYFLPIGSSWGWATWKDKWDQISFDANDLLYKIEKNNLQKKMNFNGYSFFEMLEAQAQSKIDSWAIRFYASFFLKNGLFLFPNVSLVQNIGFDSTGIHCKEDNFFSSIEIKLINEFPKIPIILKKNVCRKIILVPKQSILRRIYNKLKNINI